MKIYINDFCDDLNYRRVLLYIGKVNHEKLRERLEKDQINHLYNMDDIDVHGDLIYVENCDLQKIYLDEIEDIYVNYIQERWNMYTLLEDNKGYYVETEIG